MHASSAGGKLVRNRSEYSRPHSSGISSNRVTMASRSARGSSFQRRMATASGRNAAAKSGGEHSRNRFVVSWLVNSQAVAAVMKIAAR
jgi:hypothetical protein